MRLFKINKNYQVVCESQNTRYGFRHLATLVLKGFDLGSAKACYYNRTWESYTFQSVLELLADKAKENEWMNEKDCKLFSRRIAKNDWR
jgi:hypothetical protein